MEKFNWIKEFIELRKDSGGWVSASAIVPYVFDDYFFIHWNVGIVDNFPFNDYPENNETLDETNKRIEIEREFGLFLNPKEDEHFRQTTLKEIASLFNIEYSHKVMSQIKQTPAIKFLKEISIKNMRLGIEKITLTNSLNLFVEDISRYPIEDKLTQELENLSVEDYFKWQEDFVFDYNTYLFPDDKKWCITTIEDGPILLCTKSEDSERIIKEFNMELFKVSYNEKLYQFFA